MTSVEFLIALLFASCFGTVASVRGEVAAAAETNSGVLAFSKRSADGVSGSAASAAGLEWDIIKDAEAEILTRRCVEFRAGDWPSLLKRLGHVQLPAEQDMANLTTGVFYLTDSAASANGTTASDLEDAAEEAAQQLQERGFDFETSRSRCSKGMTMEADECQLTAACGGDSETEPRCNLGVKLRYLLDVEELLAQVRARRHFWQSKGIDEVFWNNRYSELRKEVESEGYKWSTRKSCEQLLKEQAAAARERIVKEMSVGKGDGAECHEAPDGMCPEGTLAATKRRRNLLKGAAVMSTGALISKFTLLPLGAFIGGFGGPVAGVAGGVVGNVLGVGLSALVAYYVSRGPLECACFDRDCVYRPETDSCDLDGSGATKNPFGARLPVLGTKCTPKQGRFWQKGPQCALEQCVSGDFTQKLPLEDMELFGSVGRKGRSLFNCISERPLGSGPLVLADQLPNGRNNTAEERAELFREILG